MLGVTKRVFIPIPREIMDAAKQNNFLMPVHDFSQGVLMDLITPTAGISQAKQDLFEQLCDSLDIAPDYRENHPETMQQYVEAMYEHARRFLQPYTEELQRHGQIVCIERFMRVGNDYHVDVTFDNPTKTWGDICDGLLRLNSDDLDRMFQT